MSASSYGSCKQAQQKRLVHTESAHNATSVHTFDQLGCTYTKSVHNAAGAHGKERKGKERKGKERKGKEMKGKESRGTERKVKERNGKERKGKERKREKRQRRHRQAFNIEKLEMISNWAQASLGLTASSVVDQRGVEDLTLPLALGAHTFDQLGYVACQAQSFEKLGAAPCHLWWWWPSAHCQTCAGRSTSPQAPRRVHPEPSPKHAKHDATWKAPQHAKHGVI